MDRHRFQSRRLLRAGLSTKASLDEQPWVLPPPVLIRDPSVSQKGNM